MKWVTLTLVLLGRRGGWANLKLDLFYPSYRKRKNVTNIPTWRCVWSLVKCDFSSILGFLFTLMQLKTRFVNKPLLQLSLSQYVRYICNYFHHLHAIEYITRCGRQFII